MTEKHCVTCHQDGHTYLECPSMNFFDLFAATAWVPNLAMGESADELRERFAGEIESLPAKPPADPG